MKGPNQLFTRSFSAGTLKSFGLNESMINSPGEYTLEIDFMGDNKVNSTINKTFYVANAEIMFNQENYDVDEEIQISFSIEIPNGLTIESGVFFFGDNNQQLIGGSTTSINKQYLHSYEDSGNYIPKLQIILDTEDSLSELFEIEGNQISVETSEDTTSPDIDLIYPSHNSIIYQTDITFEFEATDSVKMENCTFRLYNDSNDDELDNVEAFWDDFGNGETLEYKVVDFDDGDYLWEVECYDNSSNSDYDFNSFKIRLDNSSFSSSGGPSSSEGYTDYELKEELEEVLDKVNDFLENFGSLEIDEKEFLEDLGISEDIPFYKKRLIQIDQYFKENYKYVDSDALREQKDREYAEEFENIKNNVPKEFEILDSYEYVKNSVEIDLVEVVEDYMESTNTQISKGFAKKLAALNSKLQQEISVEADLKEIKIVYENRTEEFVLVKKKVDIKDTSYDQILEIIPKEIAESADEVYFLVDNQVIKEDPIFEILEEDLTDKGEIIYYLKKSLDLKDFTKTETILFEEAFKETKVGVTGFFAGGFITDTSPVLFAIILLLVVVLIILFLFVFRGSKRVSWKKEPNVVKCFELVRQAKVYLKEKDVERARENYRKLKEIYPVLPPKPKDYFYKEIKEISQRIDRVDIFGLVKEYEESRRGFNKEDCLRIYGEIKKVYERLPMKDRQKIYERISK
jgi:uncharacterized membrane protein